MLFQPPTVYENSIHISQKKKKILNLRTSHHTRKVRKVLLKLVLTIQYHLALGQQFAFRIKK